MRGRCHAQLGEQGMETVHLVVADGQAEALQLQIGLSAAVQVRDAHPAGHGRERQLQIEGELVVINGHGRPVQALAMREKLMPPLAVVVDECVERPHPGKGGEGAPTRPHPIPEVLQGRERLVPHDAAASGLATADQFR